MSIATTLLQAFTSVNEVYRIQETFIEIVNPSIVGSPIDESVTGNFKFIDNLGWEMTTTGVFKLVANNIVELYKQQNGCYPKRLYLI